MASRMSPQESRPESRRHKIWKNGKIAYYYDQANASFWDNHWEKLITRDYYKRYEDGDLDEYLFFEEYLRKEDFILEAGCGTAQYVVALRSRGFKNIEGIDWGSQTISRVKAIYPDLPIKIGDVAKIETGNNYFDGYISLGVVEHRKEGPQPYLAEAFRVIKPGGYAFISVPYINALRCLKSRLGFYGKIVNTNMLFYQYAFSKSEFQNLLEKAGFETMEAHGIAGLFCLREELPFLFFLLDRMPGGWRVQQYMGKFNWINNWGHMILFVCKKR